MKLNFKDILKISNLISVIRMLLVFPTIYYLSKIESDSASRIIVILFFTGAYISDLLDGFLARKLNQITELGKIIDPLADKIFVGVVVFQLYFMNQIPEYYFWIIISRDVIIFVGGIFVSKVIGKVLPSNLLGKLTVASIASFFLTVVGGASESSWIYNLFLYLSIFMSISSVIGYAIRGFENVKWYRENKNV